MKRGLENVKNDKLLIFLNGNAEAKVVGTIEYIDMGNVQYITNSDIAQLITRVKAELSRGKEVRLINVKENVQRFIYKMGLKNILLIERGVN